ncbi:phospholipase D2-like [Planoprotostelium fungivorum]|uniref:phospholipase D n=1 Tax=Planoprotostelium fungivorum TaxID=1890364 RepID=A0A2P6MWZ8_9EUKA|nr:phospholipase D2-like [Planoprotostelium fungivorum]
MVLQGESAKVPSKSAPRTLVRKVFGVGFEVKHKMQQKRIDRELHIPLDDEEEQKRRYEEEAMTDCLLFSNDEPDQVPVGGSIQRLTEHIMSLDPLKREPLVDIYLLTLRPLVGSVQVLRALEDRYEVVERDMFIGHEISSDLVQKRSQHQQAVAEAIHRWCSTYPSDFFTQPMLAHQLSNFLQRNAKEDYQPYLTLKAAQSLLKTPSTFPPYPLLRNVRDDIELLRLNPKTVAEQMTIIEYNIVSKISPDEYLRILWKEEEVSNLKKWIQWDELTTDWVSTTLQTRPGDLTLSDYFCDLATELFKIQNMNGAAAVLNGFKDVEGKFRGNFKFSEQAARLFELLEDPDQYDKHTSGITSPSIPYLQPLLRSMADSDTSMLDFLHEGVVHFHKCIQQYRIIFRFLRQMRGDNRDYYQLIRSDERVQEMILHRNIMEKEILNSGEMDKHNVVGMRSRDYGTLGTIPEGIPDIEGEEGGRHNGMKLSKDHRERLFSIGNRVKYDPGHKVVSQGKFNRYFYVVESGVLQYCREHDGDEYHLWDLSEGNFFGNYSILSYGMPAATVIVGDAGPAILLEIDRDDLKDLLVKDHSLSIEFCRCIIENYAKQNEEHDIPTANKIAEFRCRANFLYKGNLILTPTHFYFYAPVSRKKIFIPVNQVVDIRHGNSIHLHWSDKSATFQRFHEEGTATTCYQVMKNIWDNRDRVDISAAVHDPREESLGRYNDHNKMDLSSKEWKYLLKRGRLHQYEKGEVVNGHYDGERRLHFILNGSCNVRYHREIISRVYETEVIGIYSFFHNRPSMLEAEAAEDNTQIVSFDPPTLRKIAALRPEIVSGLYAYVARVMAARWHARETHAWEETASSKKDVQIRPELLLDPTTVYGMEREGPLMQRTSVSGVHRYSRRYCKLRGGFLIIYNDEGGNYANSSQRETAESVEGLVKVLCLSGIKLVANRTPTNLVMKLISPHGVNVFTSEKAQDIMDWIGSIHRWIHNEGRFKSYASVRPRTPVKSYVDGEEAYIAMAEEMEKAKRTIFINDWWLSPEIYLRRGPDCTVADRLDMLLERKAKEGVRVFVLIWNDTDLANNLASVFAKKKLEALSGNIQVMCHPTVVPFEWSHHQKNVVVDQKVAFIGGMDLCFGRWDTHQHDCVDDVHTRSRWPGKDYLNTNRADPVNPELPFDENFDRSGVPRQPWHDCHMRVTGPPARDIAANFIQRWNHHKESHPFHAPYMFLVPLQSANCPPGGRHEDHVTEEDEIGTADVQIVRALPVWASGNIEENAINDAYVDLITKADHYVYIENQYFISSTGGAHNTVTQAIVDRIFTAFSQSRPFTVIVVMPVTPEGGFKDNNTIRYIMQRQFDTIWKAETSIYNQLREKCPNIIVEDYITFHTLRSHGKLSKGMVTEQIYIHAKVAIADDCRAIIGSANINDRSLFIGRDSEIAAFVEDKEPELIKMNGREFTAAKFAADLRRRLWGEHLGLESERWMDIVDPVHPNTLRLWRETSKANTRIYEKIFPHIPSNRITTMKQLNELMARDEYATENLGLLDNLQGHLIDFPLEFLKDAGADMKPGMKLEKIPMAKRVFE